MHWHKPSLPIITQTPPSPKETSPMTHEISSAAILSNHIDVSNALRELQRTGCDLTRISVVGKDAHTDGRAVGYYNTGHRLNYWGTLGAFWGGLWGMLSGSAFFVVPGIGQVLI